MTGVLAGAASIRIEIRDGQRITSLDVSEPEVSPAVALALAVKLALTALDVSDDDWRASMGFVGGPS